MHACVHVCKCAEMCAYVCVQLYTLVGSNFSLYCRVVNVRVCMRACVCVCMCVSVQNCVHIHVCVQVSFVVGGVSKSYRF